MSEMEREELTSRIRGATKEEKLIIARNIDSDILWDELRSRSMRNEIRIRAIEETVKENSPADHQS